MNPQPSIPQLTWPGVLARRCMRHALDKPANTDQLSEIVASMCGAHAQILSAAELSIGLRCSNCTRTDVRQALWAEHSLIKTFGPRGTVHLLPAQDLPMWTGALSAIPQSSSHALHVRMTPDQTEAVVAAIAEALADAELTIDELSAAVIATAGPWAGDLVMPAFQTMWPRWRQAIDTAAHRGVLCFGPNRGRNVTYTNPQRWLPAFQPADQRTSLITLVKQYLHAYGPATARDFAQWLAVPASWATELFSSLAGELQLVAVDGAQAWVVAGDTSTPSVAVPEALLLPYFDAFIVGCQPREWLFPGRASARALANGQAGNYPVLLIDGIVAGVWHQRRAGRKVLITVEPLETLTSAQHTAVTQQATRVGEVLEGVAELTIGPVTTGAHA